MLEQQLDLPCDLKFEKLEQEYFNWIQAECKCEDGCECKDFFDYIQEKFDNMLEDNSAEEYTA
jgi:hypothetical protein